MAGVQELSAVDYTVFGTILALCCSIGIYFGCTGSKQRSTKEYLLADRKMPALPVAASIMASNMSAIATMGSAAETYMYSCVYWWMSVGNFLLLLLAGHFYLSVYYRLNIISVYEYLEIRYSRVVRLLATAIYIIYKLLYLSLVIYAPALALSAVTDLNEWVAVVTVGLVCTIYTTMGGMKAVIWTDLIQMILMFTGVSIVVIKGVIVMGGFANVWRIADEGGRIQYVNFDVDPKARNTVWTGTFGFILTMIPSLGASQQIAQRFNSCRSEREAIKALYIGAALSSAYLFYATVPGVILYAVYADCDPVTNGEINKPDQVIAYFVIQFLKDLPGMPGLFIAAIFSAALSTLSSGLNSLAAVFFEDFLKPCRCFQNVTDQTATVTLKILSAMFGLLSILFVYVVSNMGTLVQAALSLSGIMLGPVFGVFTLGVFFPCTNTKGVLVGFLTGIGIGIVIGTGTIMYDTKQPPLPLSTDGCPAENITYSLTNFTTMAMTTLTDTMTSNQTEGIIYDEGPSGYVSFISMSHLWYAWIVVPTTVIVGLLASLVTGNKETRTINPKLMAPVCLKCHACLPSCCFPTEYEFHEKEDNELEVTTAIDSKCQQTTDMDKEDGVCKDHLLGKETENI